MHEREEGWGLTEDGSGHGKGGRASPVMVREAVVARQAGVSRVAPVVAREAGASPVTAREVVLAREDPVASTAAPVALMRPRGSGGGGGGSGGVDSARLWWLRGRRRRQETAAKCGDGELGTQRRSGARDLGEKWWPGGGKTAG